MAGLGQVYKRQIRQFMQQKKRREDLQRLQGRKKDQEKAERLRRNLRDLCEKTNQVSYKKRTISKSTSKASKIKQLIGRKQAQILGKYGFIGFNYHFSTSFTEECKNYDLISINRTIASKFFET